MIIDYRFYRFLDINWELYQKGLQKRRKKLAQKVRKIFFVFSVWSLNGMMPEKHHVLKCKMDHDFYGLWPYPPQTPPPDIVFFRIWKFTPIFSFANMTTNGWNNFYIWSNSKIYLSCSLILTFFFPGFGPCKLLSKLS